MRLGLAILATLLNAAGPWLCCCTAIPTPEPVPPAPRCCHEEPPAPQEKAPPPPCPCKARLTVAAPARPAEPSAELPDAASDHGPAGEPATRPLSVRAAPEVADRLPWRTAERRIRAHHAMLC